TRLAVESSVDRRSGKLIATLFADGLTRDASAGRLALLRELSAVIGSRQESAEVAGLLESLAALKDKDALRWQMTGLDGLAAGMGRRGTQLAAFLAKLPEEK